VGVKRVGFWVCGDEDREEERKKRISWELVLWELKEILEEKYEEY
jgi:hypothetical protein